MVAVDGGSSERASRGGGRADRARRAGAPVARVSDVRLVGVTKGKDAAVIRAAVAAGLTVFGENYVQEWAPNGRALADVGGIEWHFIGRIQRNKAAAVAEASLVHSLAGSRASPPRSTPRARVAARQSGALVQINLDDEASKDGLAPATLPQFLAVLRAYAWLRVEG